MDQDYLEEQDFSVDRARYEYKEWRLHDRIFSETHMYKFMERTAKAEGLKSTLAALPYMKKAHEGQTRNGMEHIPYIYHPLLMACHAHALGIKNDDILASILLHDVCEDCGVSPEDLPFNETIKTTVDLLTYKRGEDETSLQAHERYFAAIKENPYAVLIKIIDRCNNISMMAGAFTRDRMIRYIEETMQFVMPLFDVLKFGFEGQYYDIAFLLKYHLLSVLESERFMLV